MTWQKLVLDSFQRQTLELEKVLDGLPQDELNKQPAAGQNSIGWILWHVIRSVDRNMSPLIGDEQLWITEKWHAKWGRVPDPGETGHGHTAEQAKAFRSPEVEVVIAYNRAIAKKVENYINNNLTEQDLAREVYIPTFKTTSTVEAMIAGQFFHGMHHVGQAGYVRGLLTQRGWYGR